MVAVALLNNHTAAVHSTQPTESRRGPKVDRPVLSDSISEEHWNGFAKSWSMFVQANGIAVHDQPVQLFACCDADLRSKVTATNDNVLDRSVDDIMELLHTQSVQ